MSYSQINLKYFIIYLTYKKGWNLKDLIDVLYKSQEIQEKSHFK